jgi:hypothetical protein
LGQIAENMIRNTDQWNEWKWMNSLFIYFYLFLSNLLGWVYGVFVLNMGMVWILWSLLWFSTCQPVFGINGCRSIFRVFFSFSDGKCCLKLNMICTICCINDVFYVHMIMLFLILNTLFILMIWSYII